MMNSDIDLGPLCEEHVGSVYRPRCTACDALAAPTIPRTGFIPGTECTVHSGYPLPCDRCARDLADGLPVSPTPAHPSTPHLERRVRSTDPDTSWSAAEISRRDSAAVQKVVHSIIAIHGPLTDEEIFSHYRAGGGTRTAQRVRTARAELSRPLVGEPLVREHDRAGITSTGASARRWVIA